MNGVRSGTWRGLAAIAIVLLGGGSAAAQQENEPIGRFAADVRVALPRYPDDGDTATTLGVTVDNLPSRGLGVAAGVNVYPLRTSRIALGVGGEWLLFSNGSKSLDPETEGGARSPTVCRGSNRASA